MSCNSCNECPRKVFSDGVSIVTVNGIDTLVIDIPYQSFRKNEKGCLVIIQNIPATATINMPVAVSIGGVTTTVYPVVTCSCAQVTACMLRTRRRYPFRVATNSTGGVFTILKSLSCAPDNSLATIPVSATASTGG